MSRLLMLLAMAAMVVRIREDRQRLKAVNAQLAELLTGAEKLARTDPLTGLPNRRAFLERLSEELMRARRNAAPVCIAYLDVDNFKHLNDQRGHLEGDEFLRHIAAAIKDTVRATDVAARLGGDEFPCSSPTPSASPSSRWRTALWRGCGRSASAIRGSTSAPRWAWRGSTLLRRARSGS